MGEMMERVWGLEFENISSLSVCLPPHRSASLETVRNDRQRHPNIIGVVGLVSWAMVIEKSKVRFQGILTLSNTIYE